MINNLVGFCQTNHLRLLGLMCLCIAMFIIITWLAYMTKNYQLVAHTLIFFASIVGFFTKALMWIWLIVELVVILNKFLLF